MDTLRGLLLVAVALAAGACAPGRVPSTAPLVPSTAASELPEGLVTTVTRTVDGDTLHVADLDVRVRLIGIDAPETERDSGCFGRRASAHLAALVPPGTRVVVEFDVERTDRFDRQLGYVWRAEDGTHVNLAMVEDGHAQAHTVPPNVRHHDRFAAAQRRAREAGRGLWSACG